MRPSNTLTGLVVVLVALPLAGRRPALPLRPTLLRIRVVLTTAAPAADLTLDGGTIIHASVDSQGRRVPIHAEQNRISFKHDGGGSTETQVHLLASGIRADTGVRWRLALSSATPAAEIEVYNENEPGLTRLVDRFEAHGADSIFESPGNNLLDGGPVTISPGPLPLVLAFFYPWYQHFNWSSDHLLDKPLYLYSTEISEEVAISLIKARRAGLDGVIVSWRGDTNWNDRRLQILLDQAQRLGLTVSILVETLLATEGPEGTVKPLNADKMRQWLEKAVDAFGEHPAFLRVNGRPVIFVYVADSFTHEVWRTIVESLADKRRNAFLVADSLDSGLLESFSGAFTYATASIPPRDLQHFYVDQALRTQTYNLSYGGIRRVDAATVSPGYNDTLLDRETTFVIDRANGALYDAQWRSAAAAQSDWVLVTSWNEFYENTHIEPSVEYGRAYQGRTRIWSELFHRR